MDVLSWLIVIALLCLPVLLHLSTVAGEFLVTFKEIDDDDIE